MVLIRHTLSSSRASPLTVPRSRYALMPGWHRLTGAAWLKSPKNNHRHLTVFFTGRHMLLLFCLERKMAKNYQQDGNTLDFQNTGATDIHSGDAVLSGALVGVAH